MSFLKKLGTLILRGAVEFTSVGPKVAERFPGAAPIIERIQGTLDQLASVVISAEVMGQALGTPGPDKLKAAAPQVASIILHSSVLAGRKISDPDLFNRGATKIADGMADVLNSLKDDIAVENKLA